MGGSFVVTGGQPLYGGVRVPAAKNSVLPLLAASLLCGGPVRLRRIPRLSDVESCLGLLRGVGCAAGWQSGDVVVSGQPFRWVLPQQYAAQMRASILFCAPLLARLGRAETLLPGGCRIGARPIDLHLEGLKQMGAREQPAEAGYLVLTAPAGLHGVDFTLGFPSVGATETMMLAAVCARGDTVLRGAAREPEIQDLAAFLNQCGGYVQGAGSPVIRIRGRRILSGTEFAPLADRIFASTMACATAVAGGRVEISGCAPGLYAPVLDLLEQMGCDVARSAQSTVISRFGRLSGVGRVFTGVYPGLATDAAPLAAAALLGAQSASSIEDVVFERRFGCAEGFARMGAEVEVQGRVLKIYPGRMLHGTQLTAPDLRGGAALILAALGASGISRIDGAEHIDRGYAGFAQVLSGLGARVVRRTVP
ncbi:MAG: UDP-N-acetylglucosamine 1-carboxyvinyltransferase [Faecalibacterium sp.]